MTGEQKKFLDENGAYEAVGPLSGPTAYRGVSILHPDGRLEPRTKENAGKIPPGAFLVARKVLKQPGQVPGPGMFPQGGGRR